MTKKELSESETSENSSSDEPKSPANEATEYEKQRQSRIAQNRAKLEALGLRTMANSLMGFERNSRKRKSQLKSKRVAKHDEEDAEYKPNFDDEDEDDVDDDDDSNGLSEEFEEEKKKKKIANDTTSRSRSKKAKYRKSRSVKQISVENQKPMGSTDFMDEDEALKEAIALSLKEFGEISNLQLGGSSQKSNAQAASIDKESHDRSREDNARKRKSFTSRVQMTMDDLVIHFCQFDEVGKGSITLRDLQRMAAAHDFPWTDKELAVMIRCFDSDNDGKLTLDDFQNIVRRCNMLQLPEHPS